MQAMLQLAKPCSSLIPLGQNYTESFESRSTGEHNTVSATQNGGGFPLPATSIHRGIRTHAAQPLWRAQPSILLCNKCWGGGLGDCYCSLTRLFMGHEREV